jgi:ubiquinone/menaquinone biosynthesis C-methylase UbiE
MACNAGFVGAIPEHYEARLGPLFFHFYADDMARRLDVPVEGRVLETACGTGIVTERIRAGTRPSVEIVATDVSEPMLDFARSTRGDLPNVRFETADACLLPYDDDSFDAVVSQFGLMFMPDKLAALEQARRVLRPGGTHVFSVWDSFDANPVARVAHETVCRFFDDAPPTFLPVPFRDHEPEPLKRLLVDAGFDEIRLEFVPHVVERPSARDVARGLVEGNPTIHHVRERATACADVVIDAVAEALADAFGDAPLRTELQAIVLSGRVPA